MRLLPVAVFAAAVAALSGAPAADGRPAGVPPLSVAAMLTPPGAAPACGPSIHHVSLRTPPEFCPRPLALTQRIARGPRLLHT